MDDTLQRRRTALPLLVFPQGNLTASNEIRKGGFFMPSIRVRPPSGGTDREDESWKSDKRSQTFCLEGRGGRRQGAFTQGARGHAMFCIRHDHLRRGNRTGRLAAHGGHVRKADIRQARSPLPRRRRGRLPSTIRLPPSRPVA